MIFAYLIINMQLERLELTTEDRIPDNVVWIDLVDPTSKEEQYIERTLMINTPTREEVEKNEVMSPFYREGNAYYMTITVLYNQASGYSDSTAITFILIEDKHLVTIRYTKPRAFSHFVSRAMRAPHMCGAPESVLEGLIEVLVNSIADVLEKAGNELDKLLKDLFEKPNLEYKNIKTSNALEYHNIIKRIGKNGNMISKNRESLVSINRMLLFFSQIETTKTMQTKDYKLRFKTLSREVQSLSEYVNFLSQRNSFLLDATLGMIGVEQNMIIKAFTIGATAMMPPTLLASVYGMNFHNMPELNWAWGYPMAILMIIISAIIPYYFFKKKGWI